eukprot:c39629_g1_i1 orf=66-254(+)
MKKATPLALLPPSQRVDYKQLLLRTLLIMHGTDASCIYHDLVLSCHISLQAMCHPQPKKQKK